MDATQQYIEALTVGLSSQTGIKIKSGDNWSANVKDKVLVYNLGHLTSLPFGVVRGLLLHEIGHLLYSKSIKRSPAVKKYGGKMMELYNPLEDIRIERKLGNDYVYYAQEPINEMNFWGIQNLLNQYNKDFTKLPKIRQFSFICLFSIASSRDDFTRRYLVGYGAEWAKRCQYGFKFDKKVTDKFKNHHVAISDILWECERLNSISKLQELIDTRLLPLVKDLFDDKGKGKKSKSNNKKSGQSSKGRGGQGNSNKKDKDKKQRGKQSNASLSDASKGNKFGLRPTKNKRPIKSRPTESEATALMYPYAVTLAQRLRDILKEQSALRWRGQHLSGKLLGKDTYKVCIPKAKRIFSKKTTPDAPDYDMYMAIDSSGSMNGERSVHAFMSACLLKKTCQILGFDLKLYKFSIDCDKLDTLDDYNSTGDGTVDGSAFEAISKDMSDKPSIVFIVTDGETSKTFGDRNSYIKDIKKKGGTIYGIGIGSDISESTMRTNYENPVLINKSENLPREIISIMRKIIKR